MSSPSNQEPSPNSPDGHTKTSVAKAGDVARKAGLTAKAQSKHAFNKGVEASSRLSPSTLAWCGIACAAIILMCANLLAGTWFKNWRADLTEDGLYSMSPSTERVLTSIDEPITVQLYFTKALGEQAPAYATYFQRVRSLLERYRDMSGGKLQLAFINPPPFSDAEDRAVASGLRGIRLNAEGDMAYFGLVATNTTDNVERIGFFSPDRERFLEYDLTKLVHTLSNPKKKVVGLISGLPLEGGPGNPMTRGRPTPEWAIVGQIRDFFDVRTLDQTVTEIPADVDTLVLVQPTELTSKAAYAVDQFALKGGRVLAFVDPVAEVNRMLMGGMGGGGELTEFKKLIDAWGVDYDGGKVAADISHARRVQFGGTGGQPQVTQYVAWLQMPRATMDTGSALTAGVESVNVASPGAVASADKATTKFEPILRTSERGALIAGSKIGMRPDPLALLRDYVPGGKHLILAARVSGQAKTAFPNGPPKDQAADMKGGQDATGAANKDAAKADVKADDKTGAKASDQQLKSGNINVILVADTDLLHDQFWVDERDFLGQRIRLPFAHNAVLVVNMIENLSGGEALRELRGRGVKPRPFTVVDDIRRDAEQRFRRKEQVLEAKLQDTQKKLAGIERRGEGGKVILTDKEREAIDKFRSEMLETRRELRSVKLAMRQDIDRLDSVLKFANIAAIPLLIGFGALGLAIVRRRTDRSTRPGS